MDCLKTAPLIFVWALLCNACVAQPSSNFVKLVAEAEKETDAKNWQAAITLWEKVNQQNPVHGNYAYQLGNAYLQVGNFGKAIEYFDKNFSLSSRKSYYGALNLAKAYAKKGDQDNALRWIKKSFDLGMPNRSEFRNAAFDALKSIPEYQRMAATKDVSKLNRVEGWRYDLNFLKEEITRKAFHVVRDFTKEDLETEVKKIDATIPTLTDMQVTVELMKLLVKVCDGHTMLYVMMDNAELMKYVPVEFYWFNDGLYIVQVEKAYQELLGVKVQSIEGKSPEQFIAAMDPILSRDNSQTISVMGTMRMRQTALMHALGLAASPDKLEITILDKNGQLKKITLPGTKSVPSRRLWDGLPDNWLSLENEIPARPFYLKDRYRYYWFEYLPNEKTIWFQYNRVLIDPANPYDDFLDKLFTYIEKNPVERLVIDVRNNNGGNGELSYPLIQKLIKCEKINQPGKLFVITGRKTFSAAGICISLLEKHTHAIFAGEPAGTSPNFIGEEFEFELPYSHLRGNISDREHHNANAVDYRTWIAPTIYAAPTFKDFTNGKDAAWEGILSSFPLE